MPEDECNRAGIGEVIYDLDVLNASNPGVMVNFGSLYYTTSFAYHKKMPPPGGHEEIKRIIRKELHEYLRKIVAEEDKINEAKCSFAD